MKYGYARVSTEDQTLEQQIFELKRFGAEKIYTEKESGAKQRAVLESLLLQLTEGDIVIVKDMTRIGRSLLDLVKKLDLIRLKKAELVCIDGGKVDTTTPEGKYMWRMIAVLSEYERDKTIERTKAALKARKKQGVILGRPKTNKATENEIIRLHLSGIYSKAKIAKLAGVSRQTVYNVINRNS